MNSLENPTTFLRSLFDAAVASAQPAVCLPSALPALPESGRLIVIGAGKASAEMARVAEQHYFGNTAPKPSQLTGLVITRYGHGARCQHIEIVEAAHPVPDAAGFAAAARMLAMVQGLSAADTVLCLLSGGGSALAPLPLAPMSLDDKQSVNRALLASGAAIGEMNCVRRHLSALKGGRLAAAAHPARVVSLAISDVPGDAPADIASGPTVADATTLADAREIIARYKIALPAKAQAALASPNAESIKPGDARMGSASFQLIATPQMALEAAARTARAAGVAAYILGDALEGEARHMGTTLAGIALQAARHGQPFQTPCVLLSGGESTVTLNPNVEGKTSGGRNVEFLLALALALEGHPRVHALAGDTDGIDGLGEWAGAQLAPDTLARAWAKGIQPRAALSRNDAHTFFSALGDSFATGPTLTNVNDFRAIYVA
jgi:glycerate 2-kinase